MAATTGHSINTGPYGENTEIYSSLKLLHWLKLCINHWKVLYKLCVFYVDRNSKMTTTAGHSFYTGPIGSFYNQVNDTGSCIVLVCFCWNRRLIWILQTKGWIYWYLSYAFPTHWLLKYGCWPIRVLLSEGTSDNISYKYRQLRNVHRFLIKTFTGFSLKCSQVSH
jgi:hypothetical protein